MKKWVYNFNQNKTDGDQTQKDLLGGKGANLAQMSVIGLPVPPGFTVTTEACLDYYREDKKINDEIRSQVTEALQAVEKLSQKEFGGRIHCSFLCDLVRVSRCRE